MRINGSYRKVTRRRFLAVSAAASAAAVLPGRRSRAAEPPQALDIHAHLPLLKFGGPLAPRFASRRSGLSDAVRADSFEALAAVRIADMDAWGVSKTTLMPIDFHWGRTDDPHWAEAQAIAVIARQFPERFVPFFACDPRRPDALELLDRAAGDLGMKGVKLHPLAGFPADDESVYPFYERCAALELPIVGHCRPIGMPDRDDLSRPERYGRVAAAFPKLQVCLGHLGGDPWMAEAIDVVEAYPNAWGDLSTNQGFALERTNVFANHLRRAMDGDAAGRIMYASDWPTGRDQDAAFLDLLRFGVARDDALRLSDAEVRAILHDNAAAFLGAA